MIADLPKPRAERISGYVDRVVGLIESTRMAASRPVDPRFRPEIAKDEARKAVGAGALAAIREVQASRRTVAKRQEEVARQAASHLMRKPLSEQGELLAELRATRLAADLARVDPGQRAAALQRLLEVDPDGARDFLTRERSSLHPTLAPELRLHVERGWLRRHHSNLTREGETLDQAQADLAMVEHITRGRLRSIAAGAGLAPFELVEGMRALGATAEELTEDPELWDARDQAREMREKMAGSQETGATSDDPPVDDVAVPGGFFVAPEATP